VFPIAAGLRGAAFAARNRPVQSEASSSRARDASGSQWSGTMKDTTVKKVCSAHSPAGDMGQTYLASGKAVSMRLWQVEPSEPKEPAAREYETVGYVVAGRAELHIEGQVVLLETGDSWLVPKGATHSYRILERFTAVEATSPPAQVHSRDTA
jgi:quercetin dioxygenase-like cupin family protein